MGVPAEAPDDDTAPIEVIALKSRTAPVVDAVAETRAALAWLKTAGAARFFWKYCSTFNSTAKGNIGPVAEALMADLDAVQTIYCPAFPENRHAIFMGNLFVGEQPLAESAMKDHPLTPMRDSNLMRLLAPQVTKPVGLANRLVVAQGPEALKARLDELVRDGVAHVVVDAVANEDLSVIAEACRDMVLMTGGSAVAMPLPEFGCAMASFRGTHARHRSPICRSVRSSCGSCSAMTNRQVSTWRGHGPEYRLDPLELADDGPDKVLAWLADQPVDATPIVYATADPAAVKAVQSSCSGSPRPARSSSRRSRPAPSPHATGACGGSWSRGARPQARSPRRSASRGSTSARRMYALGCPGASRKAMGTISPSRSNPGISGPRPSFPTRWTSSTHERRGASPGADLPAGEVHVRPRADRRVHRQHFGADG